MLPHPPRASLINSLLDSMMHVQNIDLYSSCLLLLQEGRKLGYSTMAGVPMVATSPMRHDMSSTAISPNGQPGIHPADIHSYEPPWKALCDFALHSDLDRPGYNHLVNEGSSNNTTIPNYLRTYLHIHSAIMGLTKITL